MKEKVILHILRQYVILYGELDFAKSNFRYVILCFSFVILRLIEPTIFGRPRFMKKYFMHLFKQKS